MGIPVQFRTYYDPDRVDNMMTVDGNKKTGFLLPGEVVKIKIGDRMMSAWGKSLVKHGVEDLDKVTIDMRAVYFDDHTDWMYGQESRPDPGNPGKRIRIDRSSLPKASVIQEVKNSFPIVKLCCDSNLTPERKERGKKFNGQHVLNIQSTEDNTETLSIDWADGLPALPVKKSQIIVVGTVAEAAAFVSEDGGSVYSEFKIDVTKVIKNSGKDFSASGLSVQRPGGIVEYPSGTRTWFRISGQRMPILGRRYLFFITNDFPMSGPSPTDLFLITAYELRQGKVYPLDFPNGGTRPIATSYESESILLDNLQKALN
jgi:hypothetical protein